MWGVANGKIKTTQFNKTHKKDNWGLMERDLREVIGN